MENDDQADGRGRDAEGTPRWVKVFAVVGIAVVLLLVVALLTGGHGPGRHGASGHSALDTAPASHAHRGVAEP